MVAQVCGCTPEELLRVAELLCANSGRERTSGDRLRGRLDAAHDRRADDPRRRHPPTAAGQHRPARRRHHGDARPFQHPGLDRHPDAVRPLARLPAPAGRRRGPRDAGRLHRARGTAHRLLVQLPQVHRQPAQGVVRRGGHAGERFRLRLAAADRRRLFAAADVRPNGHEARVKGTSSSARTRPAAGPTPGCIGPGCGSSTGWSCATGSRPRPRSSGRTTRTGPPPSEIETEVFFIPAAASAEKDGTLTNTQRLLQWHDKAVDPPGDCRSDAWFVYNLGKRLKGLYAGSIDPRDQPLLNLTWDYDSDEPQRLPDGSSAGSRGSRTSRRCSGDQRLPARRGRPAHRTAAAPQGLRRAEGRRLDGVRLLDLQRRLSRAGPQRAAERDGRRRQPAPAGVGLRLAAQPPGHVQPRLGRPRGPAVVRAQEADLVGRGEAPVGRPRRAGLRARQAARLSARRPTPGAWTRSPATSRSS